MSGLLETKKKEKAQKNLALILCHILVTALSLYTSALN